jgi:hypothetical protein
MRSVRIMNYLHVVHDCAQQFKSVIVLFIAEAGSVRSIFKASRISMDFGTVYKMRVV